MGWGFFFNHLAYMLLSVLLYCYSQLLLIFWLCQEAITLVLCYRLQSSDFFEYRVIGSWESTTLSYPAHCITALLSGLMYLVLTVFNTGSITVRNCHFHSPARSTRKSYTHGKKYTNLQFSVFIYQALNVNCVVLTNF